MTSETKRDMNTAVNVNASILLDPVMMEDARFGKLMKFLLSRTIECIKEGHSVSVVFNFIIEKQEQK